MVPLLIAPTAFQVSWFQTGNAVQDGLSRPLSLAEKPFNDLGFGNFKQSGKNPRLAVWLVKLVGVEAILPPWTVSERQVTATGFHTFLGVKARQNESVPLQMQQKAGELHHRSSSTQCACLGSTWFTHCPIAPRTPLSLLPGPTGPSLRGTSRRLHPTGVQGPPHRLDPSVTTRQ